MGYEWQLCHSFSDLKLSVIYFVWKVFKNFPENVCLILLQLLHLFTAPTTTPVHCIIHPRNNRLPAPRPQNSFLVKNWKHFPFTTSQVQDCLPLVFPSSDFESRNASLTHFFSHGVRIVFILFLFSLRLSGNFPCLELLARQERSRDTSVRRNICSREGEWPIIPPRVSLCDEDGSQQSAAPRTSANENYFQVHPAKEIFSGISIVRVIHDRCCLSCTH